MRKKIYCSGWGAISELVPKLFSVGTALPCKVLSPLNIGVPTSEVLGQILRKNSKIYRNLEIRRWNSYPFPKNVCALLQ